MVDIGGLPLKEGTLRLWYNILKYIWFNILKWNCLLSSQYSSTGCPEKSDTIELSYCYTLTAWALCWTGSKKTITIKVDIEGNHGSTNYRAKSICCTVPQFSITPKVTVVQNVFAIPIPEGNPPVRHDFKKTVENAGKQE